MTAAAGLDGPRPFNAFPDVDAGVVTVNDSGDLVDENRNPVTIPDGGGKFEVQVPGRFFNIHKAIRENLTIAACRFSNFNSDSSWTDKILTSISPAQYELIRGVFWNDDPRCLLYKDDHNDNRSFGLGAEFLIEFGLAGQGPPLIDADNLTYRTHFGNLQFLHAMGATVGEKPQETLRKIEIWLRTMYDVYKGDKWQPDDLVKSTALGEFFNDGNGHSSTTFRSLLMGSTPNYSTPDIRLRALGTCLHLIEDSYAKGHCRRDVGKTFQPGNVPGTGSGLIQNFHCYKGQDSSSHGHWDEEGGDNLNPQDINSFNGIYGGRAAISAAVSFLNAALARLQWDGQLAAWFTDCFHLHPNATPSDTTV